MVNKHAEENTPTSTKSLHRRRAPASAVRSAAVPACSPASACWPRSRPGPLRRLARHRWRRRRGGDGRSGRSAGRCRCVQGRSSVYSESVCRGGTLVSAREGRGCLIRPSSIAQADRSGAARRRVSQGRLEELRPCVGLPADRPRSKACAANTTWRLGTYSSKNKEGQAADWLPALCLAVSASAEGELAVNPSLVDTTKLMKTGMSLTFTGDIARLPLRSKEGRRHGLSPPPEAPPKATKG